GRIVRADAGSALELRDKGMKRTVGVVRRTLISHPAVRAQRGAFGQRCDDARLADARFARNQHYLALPLPCPALARENEFDLVLAADKADRARRADRLEATLGCGRSLHRPDCDGFGYSLDLTAAEIAKSEEITK